MRVGTGHGSIYRPKGRDGKPTRWYWTKYRAPGDAKTRREPTNPRTDDEQEALRQLHARMGELPIIRKRRQQAEDLLVRDLLALYVADCEDKGQGLPPGHIEAWTHLLGTGRATDVERDHLDTVCRRWRKVGVNWNAGTLTRSDGLTLAWQGRDPTRVRPLRGATCNRFVATLRRAYQLGREKRGLLTPLTFPHFEETARGEYLTEDQCLSICAHYQARQGAAVKADVFRLGYLLGTRKGQLRHTCKRHVLIVGNTWKLRWPGEETKNGRPHEIVLLGEPLAIVQRAWAARRPDCEYLFHVEGKPLGRMRSELPRTCKVLGIPYGRGRGIVWHDTRHSAVTNLVASGTGEAAAMTITGHTTPDVFKRYNVRRDDVQAEALSRMQEHLATRRGTESIAAPPTIACTAGRRA
jgi:integrase